MLSSVMSINLNELATLHEKPFQLSFGCLLKKTADVEVAMELSWHLNKTGLLLVYIVVV